jgi:hypothetical protein
MSRRAAAAPGDEDFVGPPGPGFDTGIGGDIPTPGFVGEPDDDREAQPKPPPPEDLVTSPIVIPEPVFGVIDKIRDELGGQRVAPAPDVPAPPAGHSFTNPLPSSQLKPGFTGFFQVETGDTLIKIVRRMDYADSVWRALRDDPGNGWAKEQTPPAKVNTFGIMLVANYGKNPNLDCVVPGYKAKLYKTSPLTGQFPILHWGGGNP